MKFGMRFAPYPEVIWFLRHTETEKTIFGAKNRKNQTKRNWPQLRN